MDLSRAVYSRDLKIAAMRALDAGSATGEIARKYQLSPKLLERWRGEWRAKGEMAFPGIGRSGVDLPAVDTSAPSPYAASYQHSIDSTRSSPTSGRDAMPGVMPASCRTGCSQSGRSPARCS